MKTASPLKTATLKRTARKPAVIRAKPAVIRAKPAVIRAKPAVMKAKPAATGRISVRLKPVLAEKLAEAQREQGLSVTEIIEAALEKHLTVIAPRKPRMTLLEAFEKNGVLGAVDLGPNASRDYKRLVAESIEEKYGYR